MTDPARDLQAFSGVIKGRLEITERLEDLRDATVRERDATHRVHLGPGLERVLDPMQTWLLLAEPCAANSLDDCARRLGPPITRCTEASDRITAEGFSVSGAAEDKASHP